MAHQVLARKYRPLRFSDVVGQDHVTRTLLNALAQGRIAHGYIFSGHRGIGKTTIARILASALNCRTPIGTEKRPTPEPCNQCDSCLEIRQGSAVDVIEIDAATNRGIDEIRELRDAARYAPSRDKYKIYILDEAHQITDAAFNALLKTLEEPPEHIVFMMATTQPEDIPQTIRSRCQHFSFHAVKLDDIMGQLRSIATAEDIDASDETLALLAEAGDGSMRDALSIMDQAIASSPVEGGRPHLAVEEVRELMGTVSNVVYEQILTAVQANSSADVLELINRLLDAGNGPQQLARQFVRYLRNVIMAKITHLQPDAEATGLAADLLQISPEERRRVARSATQFTEEELSRFLAIMLRTFDELGYRQEQRFHLELGLLKLVHVQRLVPIEELLSQLGVAPPGKVETKSSAVGTRTAAPASGASGSVARPVASSSSQPASAIPGRPSPFEADRNRKSPSAPSAFAASAPARAVLHEAGSSAHTEGALALDSRAVTSAPQPVAAIQPDGPRLVTMEALAQVEPAIEPMVLSVPEPIALAANAEAPTVEPKSEAQAAVATPAADNAGAITEPNAPLDTLQTAMATALAATKGQQSASEQLEDATFALKDGTLEVQTELSATMLTVVFNAECERILKNVLREQGHGAWRLKLVPGAPAAKGATAKKRNAPAGSAKELAANHPVVQQAQRLFSAEIRNVVDLRKS